MKAPAAEKDLGQVRLMSHVQPHDIVQRVRTLTTGAPLPDSARKWTLEPTNVTAPYVENTLTVKLPA